MNPIRKSIVSVIALSAMVATGYGQVNTQQPSPTPPNMQTSNTRSTNTALDPTMQLIEINNAEVALAKSASGKAQSPAVKAYADMLVKDHSAALTKLRDVEGVTTTDMKPNATHQATADRLAKLSGAEFDREYIATMISGHKEALDFLEKQSKLTTSPPAGVAAGKTTLAKVSADMIPTVRAHLQEAEKLQKDLGGNTSSTTGTTNRNNSTNTTPAPGTPAGGNR